MTAPTGTGRRALRAVAWGAVIASFPIWIAAFAVAPFLPLPAGERAAIAAGCIAAGEALFWIAGFYLGADVLARFRTPKVTTGRSLRGKRVVVVGATGGLGEAVARAAWREGGELLVVGRNEARLTSLARDLGSAAPGERGSVRAVASDLSAAALREAAERAGPCDLVICATGLDVRKPLQAHDDAEVDACIDVDLCGPIRLTKAFLPKLREGGVIALFGGFADGGVALPYYSVDVAARAGLAGFCAAVNRELAVEDRSQRLCYVCPAPADTEAERAYLPLWRELGTRIASPPEVANFVLQAVLAKRPVAVMGAGTRALARLQGALPWLGHAIVVRFLGKALRSRFSRASI